MNPFDKSLDATFRGRKVRVISNHDAIYEGYIDRFRYDDRHVILEGAEQCHVQEDGSETREHVGSAFLAHVDTIHLLADEQHIQPVALDAIEPAPYHSREFERGDNLQYIERVRTAGTLHSFPVVRALDEGYEVIEGHKRLWVCQCAGLASHPVEVIECSDWEATRAFVTDHLPPEIHVEEDGSTDNDWYETAAIETAIQRLIESWGERALSLHPVAYNVERLDLAPVLPDSETVGKEASG
jgi:hypothetical protein